MRKKLVFTTVSIAIILISAFFVIRFLNEGAVPLESNQTSNNKNTNLPASTASESGPLVIGDGDAPVTIIEYADYKCPECGKFHQSAGKQIRKEYVDTGKVKIVFRPYPLFSEDGGKALGGSYCALAQGKFTQYHDSIFAFMWDNYYQKGDYQKAVEPVLTDSVMAKLISGLGMDVALYETCIADKATRTAYDADVLLAGPDEIQGTPSLIIGGEKVVGNQPYTVYKTLLDIQLR